MPSSLIFAALAGAWLVVLVPMVAKRRQEVVRTADSALASRVLRRPDPPRAVPTHDQEVRMIGGRIAQQESASDERRYRSGRGGYDPEVAAQVARAKYAYRQRVVLGLAIGVVVTLVLAYTVSGLLWWMNVAFDMAIVGYLGYLRRQVSIEEEVRQRRAARLVGSRATESRVAAPVASEDPLDAAPARDKMLEESTARPAPTPSVQHSTAVALDLDDEDPVFDELERVFQPPYRRAVGE